MGFAKRVIANMRAKYRAEAEYRRKLKKKVKKARRKAYLKEAEIQAGKTATIKAQKDFAPKKKTSFFSLGQSTSKPMSEADRKKQQKKLNDLIWKY